VFDFVTIPLDFGSMFLGFADFSSESAGTRRILTPLAFESGTLCRCDASPLVLDKRDQPINRPLAIAVLGARFLRRNRDPQRAIHDGYCRRNLVNMLASRSGRTRKMLIEIVSSERKFLQAIG
jgi:hypothetical protein